MCMLTTSAAIQSGRWRSQVATCISNEYLAAADELHSDSSYKVGEAGQIIFRVYILCEIIVGKSEVHIKYEELREARSGVQCVMERTLHIVSIINLIVVGTYYVVALSTFVGQMPHLTLEVSGEESDKRDIFIGQTIVSYAALSSGGPPEIGTPLPHNHRFVPWV